MKPTATLTYRNIPDSYGTERLSVRPGLRAPAARLHGAGRGGCRSSRASSNSAGWCAARWKSWRLTAVWNPPVLHLRARNSSELQKIEKHPSYVALERYAFSEYGLAAMSHRGDVFGRKEKLPNTSPRCDMAARPYSEKA